MKNEKIKKIFRYVAMGLVLLMVLEPSLQLHGQIVPRFFIEKIENQEKNVEKQNAETGIYYNPIYGNLLDKELVKQDLQISQQSGEPVSIQAVNIKKVYSSIETAGAYLKSKMQQRVTDSFEIYIDSDISTKNIIDVLLEEVFDAKKDEDGTGGNYLEYSYAGISYSIDTYSKSNATIITLKVAYYTTLKEENTLLSKVQTVLEELDLQGKAEYQKIKSIYDYICNNITYDNENVNNETYYKQYTAYAALVHGTAVCQGYAALFYLMCKQAGLESCIVSGDGETSDGWGPHAWNIVKLGNVYYNVDSTWDAGFMAEEYMYFLLNEEDFTGHYRESKYITEAFYEAYPMSQISYKGDAEGSVENENSGTVETKQPVSTVIPVLTNKPVSTAIAVRTEYPVIIVSNAPEVSPEAQVTMSPIKTAKAVILKVTRKTTKKAVIKIKEVEGADGYQILYSTSRTFKIKMIKNTKKAIYTIGNLKKGTLYYIKVRAYKFDLEGKKVYGSYSTVKKIRKK